MAREIKFRAWCKYTKEMLEVCEIKLLTSPYMHLGLRGKSPIHCFGVGDNCELMQYTGFKDCKGQEVYEGDIVNIALSIAAEVYWDFGAWQLRDGDKVGGQLEALISIDDMIQVIGNIYEHGYLLESQQENIK